MLNPVLLVCGVICAADPMGLSVRMGALDPPAELAAPVGKHFDRNAVVIVGKDGEPVLTVWFRTEIPATATREQIANGLTYREIPEGTLIGVVKFDRPFIDYRKQVIATGVYTLRFLVQPDVGDHMGTAPHPEFLVLSPASKDIDPELLEPKALLKLSAGSTGGDHPGVLLLFPTKAKEASPKLLDKDGVKMLALRTTVNVDGEKTAMGFALTVYGYSKTR